MPHIDLCQGALPLPTVDSAALEKLSLSQLETRQDELEETLSKLARFTTRTDAGTIGWISKSHKTPLASEWAEIQIPTNTSIDLIVLVPVLFNDGEKGPQADGFPEAFEIYAGTKDDKKGQLIARFRSEDQLVPRVAPLTIPLPPTTADWIRVQSSQLTTSAKGGRYEFNLSEIMVFSGERNVALTQPVRISSRINFRHGPSISAKALTDGFTPFLMDTPQGKPSQPFLARFMATKQFSFIIDLGKLYPVDEVRLHTASDIREHIPLPREVYFSLPKHFIVDGASDASFSDSVRLLNYKRNTVFEGGPILVRHVPSTPCRFIRFSVPEPSYAPGMPEDRRFVNLSELEIISNGGNISRDKKIIFPLKRISQQNNKSITDGNNSLGKILSIREWMEQLARRHDLEKERPIIAEELNRRYHLQNIKLRRMVWLSALLAVGIAFTILLNRVLRLRGLLKFRERTAANLHDELSANYMQPFY